MVRRLSRNRFLGPLASLLLVLATAGLVVSAGAQEAAQSDPPSSSEQALEQEGLPQDTDIFFDTVDVNVVNLEVFVTDRQGNRVTDLTRDDFQVYENGRPREITHFQAVDRLRDRAARRLRPEGVERIPTRIDEDGTLRLIEPEPIAEEDRLYLIVFLDNVHLRPFNRNRVTREVQSFLYRHLEPEDRAMVVTYDRDLNVRQPFTSDHGALARALDEAEMLTGSAVQSASARRDTVRRIEMSRDAMEAASHADSYARSAHHEVIRSIRSLDELVESLAGLPGRKALLHVSDGIPMTAGEDLFFLADQRFGGGMSSQLQANRYRASTEFHSLIARANSNRVSFYTLDAAGLRSHASLSAEYGAVGSGQSYLEADTVRNASTWEPLQLMAAETGGLAAFNTNNIAGALERVAEDFNTYYSLAYSSPGPGDGRFRNVEVRVQRRGLQVRHRTGFRAKSDAVRMAEGTTAALLYGSGSNPLDIEVEVDDEIARDNGLFLVPLRVRIPLSRVALIPRETVHQGRLHVSLAVMDDEGLLSTPELTPIPLIIPANEVERAMGQHFVFEAQLLMRPGGQKIAVGVRDELSGDISYFGYDIFVGRARGRAR